MMLKTTVIAVLVALAVWGCGGGTASRPGQLATRHLETRDLEAPYDVAYRAATNAFFFLGYAIKHTDKNAGIIVAEVKDKGTAAKVGYILLFGVAGAFINTETHVELTALLTPRGDHATSFRLGTVINGQAVTDKAHVDRLWVVTQREAFVEMGLEVPADVQQALAAMDQEGESSEASPGDTPPPEAN